MQMERARLAPDARCGELEFEFRLGRVDGTAAHGTQIAGPVSTPRSVGLCEWEDLRVQRNTRPPTQFLYVLTVEHGIPRLRSPTENTNQSGNLFPRNPTIRTYWLNFLAI